VNIRRATALASLALLPFAGAAHAQNAPDQTGVNDELRREIDEQKQRLAVLERKLENQQEAQTAAVAAAPQVKAAPTRYSIGTADGANFVGKRRNTAGDESKVSRKNGRFFHISRR